jgi:hypothetical protein
MKSSISSQCPYCGASINDSIGSNIDEQQMGLCPYDGTPHHVACWHRNHGCTTFGCLHNPITRGFVFVALQDIQPVANKKREWIARAWRELKTGLDRDDDGAIAEAWHRSESLLADDPRVRGKRAQIERSLARQTAYERLQDAVENGDPERIVAEWRRECQFLNGYPPLERLLARIAQAEEHSTALIQLRHLLDTEENDRIVQLYARHRDFFESDTNLTDEDRDKIAKAQQSTGQRHVEQVRRFLLLEDDVAVARAYAVFCEEFPDSAAFTPAELERIETARRYAIALEALESALTRGNAQEIARIYANHAAELRSCRAFAPAERHRVRAAQEEYLSAGFHTAVSREAWNQIVTLGEQLLAIGAALTTQDLEQLQAAHLLTTELGKFRQALNTGDDLTMLRVYTPLLREHASSLSVADLRRLDLARERVNKWRILKRALERNDERQIASYYDSELFDGCGLLEAEEHVYCRIAFKRVAVFAALEAALLSDDDDRIVTAYTRETEQLLSNSMLLTPVQRIRIEDARRRTACIETLVAAVSVADPESIAATYIEATGCETRLPRSLNWKAVLTAIQQRRAIESFRTALADSDGQLSDTLTCQGVGLLNAVPLRFSSQEHEVVGSSFKRLGSLARLRCAIKSGNARRMRAAYRPTMRDRVDRLSPKEQRLLEQVVVGCDGR